MLTNLSLLYRMFGLAGTGRFPYAKQCTLYTVYYILYSVHCLLYTVRPQTTVRLTEEVLLGGEQKILVDLRLNGWVLPIGKGLRLQPAQKAFFKPEMPDTKK